MKLLCRQNYSEFWFSKASGFFSLSSVKICHDKIMELIGHLALRAALNSTTTLWIWKLNTRSIFFGGILLKHQNKAWLTLWSFHFLVLSVFMQLNTQHWDLSSTSLMSICRNVCPCVFEFVCVCMYLPNGWPKSNLTTSQKGQITVLYILSQINPQELRIWFCFLLWNLFFLVSFFMSSQFRPKPTPLHIHKQINGC